MSGGGRDWSLAGQVAAFRRAVRGRAAAAEALDRVRVASDRMDAELRQAAAEDDTAAALAALHEVAEAQGRVAATREARSIAEVGGMLAAWCRDRQAARAQPPGGMHHQYEVRLVGGDRLYRAVVHVVLEGAGDGRLWLQVPGGWTVPGVEVEAIDLPPRPPGDDWGGLLR